MPGIVGKGAAFPSADIALHSRAGEFFEKSGFFLRSWRFVHQPPRDFRIESGMISLITRMVDQRLDFYSTVRWFFWPE
jgi:hypothetical protein